MLVQTDTTHEEDIVLKVSEDNPLMCWSYEGGKTVHGGEKEKSNM